MHLMRLFVMLFLICRKAQGYSDSQGVFSARKAIMQYCQQKNIPGVDIDDIYTGNGVSELDCLGHARVIKIMVTKFWYLHLIILCGLQLLISRGGTAVHYLCDEQSDWIPDVADIKSKITDKTKG